MGVEPTTSMSYEQITKYKINYIFYAIQIKILFPADGGMAMWNNGLNSPSDSNDRLRLIFSFVGDLAWIYTTFAAFLGFVAQFIYRYLTLNRHVKVFCLFVIN
jgi:hypothetical protein